MPAADRSPELDSRRLLGALVDHRVQMVIVGGFAAQLHGATRMTRDLDLCPQAGCENLARLADALNALDGRLRLLEELGDVVVPASTEILESFRASPWRTDAGAVDVLLDVLDRGGRVPYEVLAERAVDIELGDPDRLTLTVVALADLIAMKRAAGRPKDREALPELERIAVEQQQSRRRAPNLGQPTRRGRRPRPTLPASHKTPRQIGH